MRNHRSQGKHTAPQWTKEARPRKSLILESICRVNELRKCLKMEKNQTQRVSGETTDFSVPCWRETIIQDGGTQEGIFFHVEKSTDVSENYGRELEGRQPSTLAEY